MFNSVASAVVPVVRKAAPVIGKAALGGGRFVGQAAVSSIGGAVSVVGGIAASVAVGCAVGLVGGAIGVVGGIAAIHAINTAEKIGDKIIYNRKIRKLVHGKLADGSLTLESLQAFTATPA